MPNSEFNIEDVQMMNDGAGSRVSNGVIDRNDWGCTATSRVAILWSRRGWPAGRRGGQGEEGPQQGGLALMCLGVCGKLVLVDKVTPRGGG